MKSALLWLVESLNDAADDLDVDESDIPLLPLTDDCMVAVNDSDFQNAMEVLGIHKPATIQVIYLIFVYGSLFYKPPTNLNQTFFYILYT